MLPAFTAVARSAAAPINRFGVMYVPNGMIMKNWAPRWGVRYQFNPTMIPLAPSGTDYCRQRTERIPPAGTAVAAFTQEPARGSSPTCPENTPSSGEIRAGISMDQILAKETGKHTQLRPLELAMESTRSAGACDKGYACAYTSTICWKSENTPMPMENNPRVVFERLFGDTGSTDPKARLSRIQQDRSVLDSVIEEVAHLEHSLRQRDRSKLNEYLDAIRDVEQRIQIAEAQSDQNCRWWLIPPASRPPTRAREAADRSAGAGVSVRSDARHDADGGPRIQRHDLSADRRARRAPSDFAPSEPGGEDREGRQDQSVPRERFRPTCWRPGLVFSHACRTGSSSPQCGHPYEKNSITSMFLPVSTGIEFFRRM